MFLIFVATISAVGQTEPAYSHRRPIAIDHTKVSNSDQSNFPVLISGAFGYLATVANGGQVQNARGYDIIFSTDAAGSNQLDHEMESYDPATGVINSWVRIPSLSHSTDTVIYVQYGKIGVTASQENRAGVWDANYKGVWHFSNDASLNANDSTGNGNNGTIGSESSSMVVLPSGVHLSKGQTQQFRAASEDAANSAVNWSISPAGAGSIDGTGMYTAPASLDSSMIVTITATSAADSTNSSSAAVTLVGLYPFRRAITIDHTKVPNTDQIDFPVLIFGTYPYLATKANGGKVENANGYDIIFSTDVAGLNQLDHEVESYDPVTGAILSWVRIPVLSHTSDTVIYVQYGNLGTVGSQQNVAGVWRAGYNSVYHLGDGGNVGLGDSGSANYLLSMSGTVPAVPGKIGGGVALNGNLGNTLYHTSVGAYPLGSSPVTLQAWFQEAGSGGGELLGYGANYYQGSRIGLGSTGSTGYLEFENIALGGVAPMDTQWHSWVGVYAGGTTAQFYIDGVLRGSTQALSGTPNISSAELRLGSIPTVMCCADVGSTDEVRISSAARSADWIAAEYNNESSPSTFYSVGIEGSSVLVVPGTVSLTRGQTQQFVAMVVDASGGGVSWSVSPGGSGGIDGTGLYTAPAVIGATQSVTITATSTMDNTKIGSATITLVPPYSFRRAITIDHTKVGGSDQSNFPLLISGTYGYLATVANGGQVQNANGYDIIFSSDAAGSNQLDHEIESYDPVTGAINFWVRIPSLSHATDTLIFVQYGNSGITTSQENRMGVWDGSYQAVWHLGNGVVLSARDSTSNANSGTKVGAPSAISGQIGGGANFGGSSDVLSVNTISLNGSDYTISTWFSWPLPSTGSWNTLTRGASADHQVIVQESTWHLGSYDNTRTVFEDSGFAMNTLSSGWHYLTAIGSGVNTSFYIDGNRVGSIGFKSNSQINYIGNYQGGGQQWGQGDEVRVSNISRSPDWVTTEYNNQNAPSTFYSVGSENTSVVVLPGAVSLRKGQTQQFTATLLGSDQAVIWSISPPGAGSIDSIGLYTAPSSISANSVVTIVATSSADSTKAGSAIVNLIGPYSFRRAIFIDHNKVPNTDQSSFPMLISGSYSFLATAENGGKVQNPKGYDIMFSSDAAGLDKLDHEIESYDPVTGSIDCWVRIPILSHTADTLIYLQYGQRLITGSQENRAGVWDSGYKDVLHFGGSTALNVGDSTSNSNSGQNGGANAVSGKISGAASFMGAQSITLPSLGSTSSETKLTLSAWVNAPGISGSILAQSTSSGVFGPSLSSNGSAFVAQAADPGVGTDSAIDTSAMAAGQWNYVVGVFEADGIELYVNGAKKATSPYRYASGALSNSAPWVIGSLNGGIDEVRFSSVGRAADWIATEYNNQSSPSTFYSLGGENAIRIFITPSAPSLYGGQSQQFTPTLINTANMGVSWQTSPSGIGSIDGSGLYSAPPTVTSQETVTLTATSLADNSQTVQATITLYPPLQVTVSPISPTLSLGQRQQFTATVSNAADTRVTWTLSPSSLGVVTSSGLYTAPSRIAVQQTVTVTATSVVDNSTSSSTSITLTPASTAYSYRRTITIDHNKVPNSLLAGQGQTNFPLLISGTYTYLATAANGGKMQSPNGYDVIFTADALGSTQLDHEIESYDPVTGTVNFWVRVPGLSFVADTVIYMQYGNASVTASGENKTGVWDSNYQMVLHLGESSSPYQDSTSNGFSSVGGVAPIQSAGKIGRGQSFDGASQYIAYPGKQSPNPEGAITMEAWIKTNDASAIGKGIFGKWKNDGAGSSDQSYELYVAGGNPHGLVAATDGSTYNVAGPSSIADGNWHHMVVAAEPFRTVSIYVDGVLSQSLAMNNILLNPTTDSLLVGVTTLAVGPYFMSGALDEARISNSTRSADWVAAEYNNQSSPSTFYAVGAEQREIIVNPPTTSLYAGQRQQFTAAGVIWSLSPAGVGSIDASGLYTAPATVSVQQTIAAVATSLADSSKSTSATVKLLPPMALTISPANVTLYRSQAQQFTAMIANAENDAVRWSMSPNGIGSLNNEGLYVAPAQINSPQSVTITATSLADPTKANSATVALTPTVNGYGYRRAIVIDHSKVANSDLNDFPLLISGTYSDLATIAHGGKVQSSNGYDIILTADAHGLSRLDHEIESYDPTTGAILLWVRIPTLMHTADTVIYVQYGNPGILASQENKTGVWMAEYKSVYHLGNGATVGLEDSGGAGYTLTAAGTVPAVVGKIGGGVTINGNPNNYLYHSSVEAYPLGSSPVTLEAWFQEAGTGGGEIVGYGANYAAGSRVGLGSSGSTAYMEFENIGVFGPDPMDAGWHSWVGVYAGGTIAQIYIDGVLLGSTQTLAGTPAISSFELRLGGIPTNNCCANAGSLDEVRISSVARSADWITTEYNNQSSPSSFYSLSPANALVLDSLTPDHGEPGASITLSGSSFGTDGSVTFNGRPATVSGWSDTIVTAVVPNGAVSGPVVVTSGGVPSTELPFTVLTPTITALNPNHGLAGTAVIIVGSNFGGSAGTVTFGGETADVSSWSDSSITVAAPSPNPGNVVVSNGGLQSNAVGFNPPTIISVSPGSGVPGSSVTINGSGFGSNGTVTFAGGIKAITASWSDSSITATVPSGAVSGNVVVTVGGATSNGVAFLIQQPVVNGPILYSYDQVGRLVGMTAASGDAVQYSYDAVGNILAITRTAGNQPAILGFRPTAGPVGTQVTISGSGFSATASQNAVSFNGIGATVNSATTAQLIVTVPGGATSGALAITSPGGSATGSSVFTVTSAAIGTSITGFSPQLQNQGQVVTIDGSGFDTQAGNNHVVANTTAATVYGAPSATSLSFIAPPGGSGRIRVITPAGIAISTTDLFVAFAGSNISEVAYTGRANLGDPVTVTISQSGYGLLLFDGKAGSNLSISTGPSSFSGGCTLALYQLDGTQGVSGSCASAGSLRTPVLPATGTYALRVIPYGGATGSVQITVSDASDVVNSIASGGVSTVTTSVPGQKGRLTFTGRAGQQVTVQLSANTFGSVAVSLVNSAGTAVSTITSSSALFSLPKMTLAATDQYTILIEPAAPGNIQVGLTLEGNGNTEPPLRHAGAVLDPTNPLATGLKGLFLMNEGTGTSTQNLVDSQAAVFSGAVQPVWSGGSLLLSGGASLNSYLDAGSDVNFDQLTTGRMTIVAKVHLLTTRAGGIPGGGIAEKNDGDLDSGFVFGINSNGAIEAIVEKSSQDMEIASPASAVVSAGWMQVAFTWDGTQGTAAAAHLFLNGVEQTKAEASDGAGYIGFANAANQPFRIGNAGFDLPGSLNGLIGYLAVYKDRILTPAELGQLDTQLPIK